MMMAQAIRIYAGQSLYSNEQYLHKVIDQFIKTEGIFSIESLVKVGEEIL